MMKNNLDSEGINSQKATFGTLNFKQIVDSVDKFDNVKQGSLYFSQIDSLPQDSTSNRFNSFINRILRSINKFGLKFAPIQFIIDLSRYISRRFRVFFVFGSVISEVASKEGEMVKRSAIRKLFWGRGNIFRFAIQFVSAFLIITTIGFSTYRKQLTEAATNDLYVAKSLGYSDDLLVQNSTTKTVLTDQSVRYSVETYIVKGGDTFSRIADYFGINVDTILWANDMVESDTLQPGMELNIPPEDGLYITVKSGDTVESLAKKYETSEQLIVQMNALQAPFALTAGEKLFLPGGKKEKPVAPPPVFTGIIKKSPGGTGGSTPIDPNVGRFLGWPVAGGAGKVSQCFSGYHNGIDISDNSSPNLVAAAPGVVTLAGCQSGNCPSGQVGGYGLAWTVIIDHGNGYSSVYGHMSTGNIYVSNGETVARGQVIGKMGQSGTAYGIHVHFMLLKSGTWSWYNAAPYMMNSICGY